MLLRDSYDVIICETLINYYYFVKRPLFKIILFTIRVVAM